MKLKKAIANILMIFALSLSLIGCVDTDITEDSLKVKVADQNQDIDNQSHDKENEQEVTVKEADKEEVDKEQADKSREELEVKVKQEAEIKANEELAIKQKEEALNSTFYSNFTKATVTKHVDGDTVHVTDENGQVFKIRMIGVDTPETVHPKKPVEFYGREASDYTKGQLLNKTVYLEKDVSETDRYARALRYIWLSQPNDPNNITENEIKTKMFNALLVINGFANSSSYPPDVKYQSYFTNYEAIARNSNIGLWGENTAQIEEQIPSAQQPSNTQEAPVKNSNTSEGGNSGINNNFADKSDTNKTYSYMGNSNSMKLHKTSCTYAKKTGEHNRVYFNSVNEASGYVPCKVCSP